MIGSSARSSGATRVFFERIAPLYRWVTDNPLWRDSVREMSRHLPPGGATLRVLDVGCGPGNSALQLLACRPDLSIVGVDLSVKMLRLARKSGVAYRDCLIWIHGDAFRLPVRDNSVDAITVHSVYYLLQDRASFLADALRVLRPGGRLIMLDPANRPFPFGLLLLAWRSRAAICVVGWHAVSRLNARFTLEAVAADLTSAGFARVLTERAVEGYGVLSRGEKPYPALTTVERIAQTAARDDQDSSEVADSDLQRLDPAQVADFIRARFLYLLIRQTPDKPGWAVKSGEPIRWQAAMADETNRRPCLLAFTSLPKAVAFMQPAVTSGVLQGINKVTKFDKRVAVRWSADMLLNPPFEVLEASKRFVLRDTQMDIDPGSAVTGEE